MAKMKKLLVLFVSIFIYGNTITAHSLDFLVIADAPYYKGYYEGDREYVGILKKGDVVISDKYHIFYPIIQNEPYTFNLWITKNKSYDYITYLENLIPYKSNDIFGNDILADYSVINVFEPSYYTPESRGIAPSEAWVPLYYYDVLRSNDRDVLLRFEPDLIDRSTYYDSDKGEAMLWYEYTNSNIITGMCMLFNASFDFGDGRCRFLLEDIKKTSYGYIVRCLVTKKGVYKGDEVLSGPGFNWNLIEQDNFYDLLMYVDGDCMDIYVDNTEQKFCSLVRVKESFIREYARLIATNTSDPSKIQWPRRADGSIASSAFKNMSGFSPTHRTIKSLQLNEREIDYPFGARLPEGTKVEILETGKVETINGITAPWVKVISSTSYAGWCFSGYLEEITEEVKTEIAVNEESQEAETATNNTNKSPLPLWAWIAIGALVAAGGAAVFVIKRKK